nr:hypothetical protein [Petrimonas sp.]
MKVVVRVLLVAAIILLAFLCWKSIQGPIDFNAEVKRRDNAVIQRLVDIRTTQVAYRTQKGSYTADFNELADFIKTGKVASVARSGDLTEEQLEAGMTEVKAMSIIRTGNEKAIRAAGLWDESKNAPQLMRDSIYAPAAEVLFPNRRINPDSLAF